MLGIIDGKGRCKKPNTEWVDDIKEWCTKDLYKLTISARYIKLWKQVMKFALDTYGFSAMDRDDDFNGFLWSISHHASPDIRAVPISLLADYTDTACSR